MRTDKAPPVAATVETARQTRPFDPHPPYIPKRKSHRSGAGVDILGDGALLVAHGGRGLALAVHHLPALLDARDAAQRQGLLGGGR
jgi:hypothetical protein